MKIIIWIDFRVSIIAGSLLLLGIAVACEPGGEPGGTRELKCGYVMAPVGATHEAAQKFAQLVSEKTAGRITVKLFPSAQLGADRELTAGLTFGSVDLVISGLASISWYVPQYEVLEAPFVFQTYEHMADVLNAPIGRQVTDDLLQTKGIRILAWWPRGPRYLTTNKEIRSPADLQGIKLRVPEFPTYIEHGRFWAPIPRRSPTVRCSWP